MGLLLCLSFAAVGCSGAQIAQRAALRVGRDAVVPCQERFHQASRTYADCARYVSDHPVAAVSEEAVAVTHWRKLGALTAGWITADRVGLLGDAEAEGGAHELVLEAAALQRELGASDRMLSAQMEMPLGLFRARSRELLDAPIVGGR